MERLWSLAGATGDNRWQMEWPRNRSNKPIGNWWQPTATVPQRMFKSVDVASGAGVGTVGFWTKEWRNEQAAGSKHESG